MSYNSAASKKARGVSNALTSASSSGGDGAEYESIDSAELTRNSSVKVTQATLYEHHLRGAGVVLQPAGGVHQGVVVVLATGDRYLIHLLPDEDDPNKKRGKTVVARAELMDNAWRSVSSSTKNVTSSTLHDYVIASGSIYILKDNNCMHAARRMMALN